MSPHFEKNREARGGSNGPDASPDAFPFPRRDLNPTRANTDAHEVGWDAGAFGDGRPYLVECWAADGMTVVTFFFSVLGLEEWDGDDFADFFESEGLVRWVGGVREVSARPVRDEAGNDMWSASVLVGFEDELFIEDGLELKPYPRNGGGWGIQRSRSSLNVGESDGVSTLEQSEALTVSMQDHFAEPSVDGGGGGSRDDGARDDVPSHGGESPRLTARFDDAFELVSELHRDHRRKATTVPYMSHLMSVTALVLEDGGDEDEAIAALLHDALEDCPDQITADGIEERFGHRVRSLVEVCTDTPPDFTGGEKPPWHERKTAYLAHVASGEVPHRISLADKVHNARSILRDHRKVGEAVWTQFSASKEDTLWYYRELAISYRAGGAEGFLIDELERVMDELQDRSESPASHS